LKVQVQKQNFINFLAHPIFPKHPHAYDIVVGVRQSTICGYTGEGEQAAEQQRKLDERLIEPPAKVNERRVEMERERALKA
jgi:hypothetical protein